MAFTFVFQVSKFIHSLYIQLCSRDKEVEEVSALWCDSCPLVVIMQLPCMIFHKLVRWECLCQKGLLKNENDNFCC